MIFIKKVVYLLKRGIAELTALLRMQYAPKDSNNGIPILAIIENNPILRVIILLYRYLLCSILRYW